MSKVLEGADQDLENLANVVQQGIADTDSGAGMAEVVIDIINKKVAWMNQLLKRCDQLDTEHLEYSRAQRKHQEVEKKGDAARIAESAALLKKEKDEYDGLFNELFASFKFIMAEGTSSLGLVQEELKAFKLSQIKFFETCHNATTQFDVHGSNVTTVKVGDIWNDFTERRIQATQAGGGGAAGGFQEGGGSTANLSASGRDLMRRGLSMQGSSSHAAPPPPPPPVGARAKVLRARALYSYDAANSDELNLTEGQTVHIVKKNDDGWFEAIDPTTGMQGLVPSNYLEDIV